jgi:hypothetical protein
MSRFSKSLLVSLVAVAGCFGHAVTRPNASTVVESLGANRYWYHLTKTVQAPPRGAAAPLVGTAPAGARELGLIEVSVEYSGAGGGGLRPSETDFYPMLGKLAGEMGGSNFLVVRSQHETRMGDWITSLTVDVLDASQH